MRKDPKVDEPQSGHSLLLAFDTDDAQFARGFEVGRLWALLRATPDDEPVMEVAHARNAEMLMRLAEATGRGVSAELHDDVWLTATFTPVDAVGSCLE